MIVGFKPDKWELVRRTDLVAHKPVSVKRARWLDRFHRENDVNTSVYGVLQTFYV